MATLIIKEKQKNALLKKYHTLLRIRGVDNEAKIAMLAGYGVSSSKDLSILELADIVNRLEGGNIGTRRAASLHTSPLDIYRKRVFASAYSWLDEIGSPNVGNADYVKAICCRKTGYKGFNKIPKERLNNLYNGFKKAKKDMVAVMEMTMEILSTN